MHTNSLNFPIAVAMPILFFAGLSCAILFAISRISGWSLLARRFRLQSSFLGQTWKFQSAHMRWLCNYNNCLTFGADYSGLYVAMPSLLSIGAPPLLIPWQEVQISGRHKVLFWRFVKFRLGREERIPLMIREQLADALQSAAGLNWPKMR